jgi:hypothetical protein
LIPARVWKPIERAGFVVGILAGLTIIFDFVTNKIGYALPVIEFLWRVLNLRLSLLFIGIFSIIVLLVFKLISRKLDEDEIFLISFIDEGERGLDLIFKAYKKKFPRESRIVSCCLAKMKKLEKRKLINIETLTGGANGIQDELFKLTKKGLKKYKKLDSAIKDRAEQIVIELKETSMQVEKELRIEPHVEVVFILNLIANQPGNAMTIREIEHDYMRQFGPKQRADLKIVINNLELNYLIEETAIGAMDELGYEILRKGLKYLEKNRASG